VSKKKLRKKLLTLRKNNYKNKIINFFLLKKVFKNFNILKYRKIGAYYPINFEIECLEILKKLEEDGYKISLPVTQKKNMDFFQWSFKDPLKVGKIGVPEPLKLKKILPDILLVPLVAFDKYNYRLGYGGGYYDRYIKKIKTIKKIFTIGFAFSFQEVKKLPINKYDKKLDFILTENYFK